MFKLTLEDKLRIQAEPKVHQKVLAHKYGVSVSTICKVLAYKHGKENAKDSDLADEQRRRIQVLE